MVPKDLIDLGSTAILALGLLGILRLIMGQIERRDAAYRAEDRELKLRILESLENHLTTISENQAKTAKALDIIVSRLLDAALRDGDG